MERVLRTSRVTAGQAALIGFSNATIVQARKRFPEHAIYWIAECNADKRTGKRADVPALIQKARAAGFDGLDLDFHFPIDADMVSKAKEAGLRVYIWTVDDPAVAWRLAAARVDGITTNRPGRLRDSLFGR